MLKHSSSASLGLLISTSDFKWALEKWWHWLQGGSDLFTVWRDHQNLISIQQTKQLTPDRCSGHCSSNSSPLSDLTTQGQKAPRLMLSPTNTKGRVPCRPTLVLPPHLLLSPLQWELEDLQLYTPPGPCFVTIALCPVTLHWAHSSTITGHPSTSRTVSSTDRGFSGHLAWPPMLNSLSRPVPGPRPPNLPAQEIRTVPGNTSPRIS